MVYNKSCYNADFTPTNLITNLQVLITAKTKTFHLECNGLSPSEVYADNSGSSVNSLCEHTLKSHNDQIHVGEALFHEWTCSESYGLEDYMMWIYEVSVTSKRRDSVPLVTSNGCLRDNELISNIHSSLTGVQRTTALSQAFKFHEDEPFQIRTNIILLPKITNNEHNSVSKFLHHYSNFRYLIVLLAVL